MKVSHECQTFQNGNGNGLGMTLVVYMSTDVLCDCFVRVYRYCLRQVCYRKSLQSTCNCDHQTCDTIELTPSAEALPEITVGNVANDMAFVS